MADNIQVEGAEVAAQADNDNAEVVIQANNNNPQRINDILERDDAIFPGSLGTAIAP